VAPAFQFSGFRFLFGDEPEKLKALNPDAAAFC
jgi:hypothetical protein